MEKKAKIKKTISDRLHHTIFAITLNTNKEMTEDQRKKFDNSLSYIFSKPKVYEYLIEKRDGMIFDKNKIVNYEYKKKIEVGGNLNRTHAHIILKIDHNMILKLDEKKIRNFYEKFLPDLGFKENNKIHLNIVGKKNDVLSWEDYMFKEGE